MIDRLRNRLTSALILIVGVCLGIRIAYWLVAPLLPVLGVMVFMIAILYVLLRRI